MVGVMRWFVGTRLRWAGPKQGPWVSYRAIPSNISHYFDTGHRTACGIRVFGRAVGEKKATSMTGAKPHRCKNCERVLAARKRHKKRGGERHAQHGLERR